MSKIFSIGQWRPGHLLLSWIAYWATIAVVRLGDGIAAGWNATRGPEGCCAIDVGYGGEGLHATVTQAGATTWTGTTSLIAVALWVAVPPLVLWLLWFVRASRPRGRVPLIHEIGAGGMADLRPKTRDAAPKSKRR